MLTTPSAEVPNLEVIAKTLALNGAYHFAVPSTIDRSPCCDRLALNVVAAFTELGVATAPALISVVIC